MDGTRSFLGTGWGFPPQFDNREQSVKMISDEEDIRNSLEVLILTRKGERILQPEYGCDLSYMLFEPVDPSLETFIKDMVFTAIYRFEPRVIPDDVTLSFLDTSGQLLLEITYTIRSTNTRHNLVIPFGQESV